jgi:hypothetical protein
MAPLLKQNWRAKLKLTQDCPLIGSVYSKEKPFVLFEQQEATIQPLPSILVERTKLRS